MLVCSVLTIQDGALCFFGLHTQRDGNGGVVDWSRQVLAGARGLEKV